MKTWYSKSEKEREDILRKLSYAFPDILAKRKWIKLPKRVKEEFKNTIN